MELRNRMQVEADFARRMSRLSARHRKELESLLGSPPSFRNVPAEFWERVERDTAAELLAILLLIAILSGEQHGLESSAAETAGQAFAARRSAEVAASYAGTSRDLAAAAEADWAARLASVKDQPGAITSREIREQTLGIFGPARAESIAITETTNAAASGAEGAVKSQGRESPDDRWISWQDNKVCSVCDSLHETTREHWEPLFPEGPPAHPRCRCYIEYEAPVGAKLVGV